MPNMDNLRGNSSSYGEVEENNVVWVVIFAILAGVLLWSSYICKNRRSPIIIFELDSVRPTVDTGSSTAINVDPHPFMMQVSSPKRRSTSPRDPADMV